MYYIPNSSYQSPSPHSFYNQTFYPRSYYNYGDYRVTDFGPEPFVINIEEATKRNNMYRSALWTGHHLQVTLMSIPVGGDIGLEIHPDTDQFLRLEQGQGIVQMGKQQHALNFVRHVHENDAIMVCGTWHNVTNKGHVPLKLYSIYAPPHHPHGTVQETKAIALAEERPTYWQY